MLLSKSQKIAVVGGGALGQYVSARLTEAGHRVNLLLRSDYEAVKQRGIMVESPDGNVHVKPGDVDVFNNTNDIGPADWVICALKSNALEKENAKKLLEPCIGDHTRVLSLLNGIGIDELMADIVGDSSRVFGGLAYIAVSRKAPGQLSHVFTEKTTIGHMLNTKAEVQAAVGMLSDCKGINAGATESLLTTRWEKLAWNFPFAGMGIVAGGVACGALTKHEKLSGITFEIMKEVVATANADILHRSMEQPRLISDEFVEQLWAMSVTEELDGYLPSTVIDFKNGTPIESEFIFHEPTRRANELKIDVPHMTMVSGLIDILSTSRASDMEHKTTTTKKKKKKEEEEQEITNRHNAAGINTGEKRVKPNKRHTVTNEEKKRKEFERRGSSITHRSCAVLMGGISISALMGRNESRLVADYGRRSFTSSSSSSSSDSDVGSKVVEQYDSEQTRQFYKTVMGGGGNDIHFGVFKSADEGVREAAANTTELMLDLMQWIKPVVPNAAQVLDLGSGHGGATHTMVQRFGTQNLCFNIGSEQNDMNLKTCAKLGIEGNVSCHRGDFNLGLPEEWSDRFDYVYSCEVLCHAADKPALLAEIRRVLKPGGVLVVALVVAVNY